MFNIPMEVRSVCTLDDLNTSHFSKNKKTSNHSDINDVKEPEDVNEYNTIYNNITYHQKQSANCKLVKGQNVTINKLSEYTDILKAIIKYNTNPKGNIDVLSTVLFMLNKDGFVNNDNWFLFYNQLNSPDRSVQLMESTNNKSQIVNIDLLKISSFVSKILFIATITEDNPNMYALNNIDSVVFSLFNSVNKEIICFPIDLKNINTISLLIGEFYLYNGVWKFKAIGEGINEDLYKLCMRYGVNVEG